MQGQAIGDDFPFFIPTTKEGLAAVEEHLRAIAETQGAMRAAIEFLTKQIADVSNEIRIGVGQRADMQVALSTLRDGQERVEEQIARVLHERSQEAATIRMMSNFRRGWQALAGAFALALVGDLATGRVGILEFFKRLVGK